jgi:hypothetical protein
MDSNKVTEEDIKEAAELCFSPPRRQTFEEPNWNNTNPRQPSKMETTKPNQPTPARNTT